MAWLVTTLNLSVAGSGYKLRFCQNQYLLPHSEKENLLYMSSEITSLLKLNKFAFSARKADYSCFHDRQKKTADLFRKKKIDLNAML